MPNEPSAAEMPQVLKSIADNPRILVRRAGAPASDGRCVVYWMQKAQRGVDNPALDVAIEVANELNLPVVAFFSAISNYPHANLRHYVFLNQGLTDIEEDLNARGVGFVVRRPPTNSLEAFVAEVKGSILIGDENHCREPERWRKVLSHRLTIPYWTVDADVVVPSGLFPQKMYALHIFKPKLYAELPKYLVATQAPQPKVEWKQAASLESVSVTADITEGWRNLDRSVGPVDTFTGGTHAALKRLQEFISVDLEHYDTQRNHPEVAGTSRLSPYLHYGHISPLTIALAANQAVEDGKVQRTVCDGFLSELIGWRELAVNFVRHNQAYDTLECAEPWALKTLNEHARDPRDPIYTIEQMEKAQTYDELWNASQLQMVKFGWMHNRMRMYWAKKILEWSPNPAAAFDNAVILNDKYELDGRDANSYSGIAWAIAGKFDRPWFDRPIFGTIRYMSGASTGKKFNSKQYINNVMATEPGLWDEAKEG